MPYLSAGRVIQFLLLGRSGDSRETTFLVLRPWFNGIDRAPGTRAGGPDTARPQGSKACNQRSRDAPCRKPGRRTPQSWLLPDLQGCHRPAHHRPHRRRPDRSRFGRPHQNPHLAGQLITGTPEAVGRPGVGTSGEGTVRGRCAEMVSRSARHPPSGRALTWLHSRRQDTGRSLRGR